MRKLLAIIALLVLGAPVLAPSEAQAQGTQVEQAKQFFEAGRQAYEAGQYAVAITAFEEAYALSPRPPVLFSLAQAYRRQYFVDRDPAKLKRAVDLYKKYLDDVKTGGRRDDAVQYISELEPVLVRVEEEQRKAGKGPVEAMTPARTEATQLLISSRTKGAVALASVDGDTAVEAPRIAEVKAGAHKVRVEAPGFFPEEIEATAVEGRLVPVEVALREMPARLTVKSVSGADISIDGRPTGASAGRPFDLPAGKHFLAVSKRGHHPYTREVALKRGEAQTVDAPLDTTTQRVVSYYVLGAAGLALVGGGVASTLAFVHQGNAQDLLDQREGGNLSQDELDEYTKERGLRDDWQTRSYFMYGGAVALAATGVLLYFIDSPRVEAGPGGMMMGVQPVVGANAMGVTWATSF